MKDLLHKSLLSSAAALLLVFSTFAARAVPNLQLDIVDGVYDPVTETIVSNADSFSLVAYGGGNASQFEITDDYFISIALMPQSGPDPVDFGSFMFDGVTYDMNDMIFGNPPVENIQDHDGGDLAPHGIFPTFFTEIAFNFDSQQTSASVNTQDNPGTDPVFNPGDALVYMLFDVNVSNLFSGFELHFDLYNTKVRQNSTDIDIDDFAPFSHDAATVTTVPESAPLALLGLGLLVLAFTLTRHKAAANVA